MMLYKHTNDFLRQSAPQRSGIALVSHGKTQLPLTAETDSSRPLTSSPERAGPPSAGLVSLPPHFGRITEPGDWFWCWSAGGSEVRTKHRFPRRDEEAVLKLEVTLNSTTAYTTVLTCRATAVGTQSCSPLQLWASSTATPHAEPLAGWALKLRAFPQPKCTHSFPRWMSVTAVLFAILETKCAIH